MIEVCILLTISILINERIKNKKIITEERSGKTHHILAQQTNGISSIKVNDM